MIEYDEFLARKKKAHVISGLDVNISEKYLFPFQSWVVQRALKAGKYGVFSGTGTGKSRMQLTWAEKVAKHTQGKVLLLAPLGVGAQTKMEGDNLGINLDCIEVNNYEQLDNIDASQYDGIALDEGSILKNFEGAYRNAIIDKFQLTPYKSVWTATPSPNDPMEIGNYAEFLGAMSRNEMLAMYFVHDGGETSKWRLKKHAEKRFWEWVSTWAVMFQHPKDIGFNQPGYDLPPLELIERQVITEKRNNGKLFNDTSVSATEFNGELRATRDQRMKITAEIANQDKEQYLIWIKHNEEGALLKKLIPGSIEVTGSDTSEFKVKSLLDFAAGKTRVIITKEKIASMGWNFQLCGNEIFSGVGFSFEQIYQAIRRCLRFGRIGKVRAYLVTTDTMENIRDNYFRKEKQFFKMQSEMTKAVNANIAEQKEATKNYNAEPIITEWYTAMQGDCCRLIKDIPDESIGLSVFSPPFADLYCYSDSLEDMGNSRDYKEFLGQFDYLIKELYRVMMQGRNVAVHCMDLPIQKGKEGFIGLRDFSGMILRAFKSAGFVYASRVTIWKDPVVEMQRTKALGLLHKQIKKDSTMSRVGIPDYVLIFRKDGERNNPVTNTELPVDLWQKYASPVWMDIDYGNTLQGHRNARDEKDEKHICPLQLDTIERLVHLYSNPGDTIYTPFGGIGSEGYKAVQMGRKAILHELKESYFDTLKKNMKEVVSLKNQKTIFK